MGLPATIDDNSPDLTLTHTISLQQFPPKLRKLGRFMLKNDKSLSITEACARVNIDRATALTEIWRAKKKGNDFYAFIDEVSNSFLNLNLMAVDNSLVDGAVSGSVNHQKLYYQRIGKLSESTNINVNVLTVGVNVSSLPGDLTRDKGVIDVEPFIPKGK